MGSRLKTGGGTAGAAAAVMATGGVEKAGGAGTGNGAGGGAAAATGAVAAAVAPSAAMTPTTVLMATVAPASTRISLRMPGAGAGISASTLSVEISKRGSSRSTLSPTFLSHLVMVPSAMDSPIWGMMTSVI